MKRYKFAATLILWGLIALLLIFQGKAIAERLGPYDSAQNAVWPNGTATTLTDSGTFTKDDIGNTGHMVFLIDPGGASRNYDPSGSFKDFTTIIIENTADAAETITFDSEGIAVAIAQDESGTFIYNGTAWEDISPGTSAAATGVAEAYGSGWNSDTGLAQKNDVYDYLHVFDADDDGSYSDETWYTALEVQLNNEAGLYAVLSDVTQFYEAGDEATILDVADSVTAGDSYTHFSTSADDDTVDELMAALDTALGVRCLESEFGTAIGTGLTLDSTTLKAHSSLQSIAGLTEADVSVLETTADNTYNVVTSGGTNRMLGSNSDNSALEFKTPAEVREDLDLAGDWPKLTDNAMIATDDSPMWVAPVDVTITDIQGILMTGGPMTAGLDICDSNGANCVAVDSDIEFNGGLDEDDGTLTNPSVGAGCIVRRHTTAVNGDEGFFIVWFKYTVD